MWYSYLLTEYHSRHAHGCTVIWPLHFCHYEYPWHHASSSLSVDTSTFAGSLVWRWLSSASSSNSTSRATLSSLPSQGGSSLGVMRNAKNPRRLWSSISELLGHGRRPGAEFGGTKKFFCGPISGKMSIFRVKISDDLFLVIDLVLRMFPFFSHIFRMFTMLNVVYDHFITRKPPFFTLFILSRTSDNTVSQNIGGDQCMGRPPTSNFGGDRPPSPP